MKTLKCDVCGHTFRALDVKLGVSAFSMSVSCTDSGSRYTMPMSQFSSKEISYSECYKSCLKAMRSICKR